MRFLLICCTLTLSGCGLNFGRHHAATPAINPNPQVAEINSIAPIARKGAILGGEQQNNNGVPEGQSMRFVINNSHLCIDVSSTSDAAKKVEHITLKLGGHIETQENNRITARIPSSAFSQAITQFEQIGTVTNKRIERKDITDQVRDDNVRLENLLAMQKRLLALIEKSQSIKDTLAIESELNRITEKIELIQTVLKKAENKVRFSTITLNLKEFRHWVRNRFSTPFAWVERIGMSIGQAVNQRNSKPRRWLRYTRPEGFVAWQEYYSISKLISADSCHIHITRHRNVEGGDLPFWSDMIQKYLLKNGMHNISVQTVPAYKKYSAHVSSGHKVVKETTYDCSVAVICSKRYIYVIESWGTKDAFPKHALKLNDLYQSMRIY